MFVLICMMPVIKMLFCTVNSAPVLVAAALVTLARRTRALHASCQHKHTASDSSFGLCAAGRMSTQLLLFLPSNTIRSLLVKRLNFAELSALEQVVLLLYN